MEIESMKLLTAESTFKHKVSSVLNRSAEFASKHMFDGHSDSCWNSDQGDSQHIIFDFGRPIKAILLRMMFQGGFAGLDAYIEIGNSMDSLHMISILNDIEDINETQEFKIRDSKYLVDRELFDNLAGTNNDPIGSSSGDEHECNIPQDTHNRMTTHNTSSNSVPDLLSCDHRYLRVKFARTADFYGRITIYNLEIFGSEKDPLK